MIFKVAAALLVVTNVLALPKQLASSRNVVASTFDSQLRDKRQFLDGPGGDVPSGAYGVPSIPQGTPKGADGYNYPQPLTASFQSNQISTGQSPFENTRPSFDTRPQIHKHIYVHVAPPEPQTERKQVISQTAQPQKHYKIIFIKAPSYSYQSQTVLPALQQDQEKTLIYVLVKKPEELGEIKLPEVKPTQPSKPEVYFIKYKTQKQTQQVGTSGGTSFTGTSGGTSFTGTSGGTSFSGTNLGGTSFSGTSGGTSFSGTNTGGQSNFGGNSYLPPTSTVNIPNQSRPNQPPRPVYGTPQ